MISTLLLGRWHRDILEALSFLAYHVDNGLWFLWMIFVLSVVATYCNLGVCKGKGNIGKFIYIISFVLIIYGTLGFLGKSFGINFLGIKYILYYSVFYGFGWILHYFLSQEGIAERCLKSLPSITFLCLAIFLYIVYNYDLYHCEDTIFPIALRCIAGFTGNMVLFWICRYYQSIWEQIKLDKLGQYTLEIYATHLSVAGLMISDKTSGFFTVHGFSNFSISLLLTALFSTGIIMVFKSIPATNLLFYGKKSN